MRELITWCLLILSSSLNAQVFDLNILRPSVRITGDYQPAPFTDDGINYTSWSAGVNALIPLKTKIDLDFNLNLRERIDRKRQGKKQKPLVEAKAHQIFFQFGGRARFYNFDQLNEQRSVQGGTFALFGIHAKFNKGTPRFFFYGAQIGIDEDFKNYSAIQPNGSLIMGGGHLFNFKTLLYYGGYVGYIGGDFVASPFIGLNTKIGEKWAFGLTLPVQTKFTFTANKKFKQDFVASLYGNQHGHYNSGLILEEGDRLSFRTTGLRVSTQSRIMAAKNFRISIQAGWQFLNTMRLMKGHPSFDSMKRDGSLFVRLSLALSFGNSLLDSSNIGFEI